VSVARLSYRSRIDQIARVGLQVQRHRLCLSHSAIFRTESVGRRAIGEESALQMRVAEESQRHRQGDQRSQRISQRDDIFVLVIGRAVYQLDVGKIWQGHWTVWQ